jgi:hypothetical protein
MEFGHWSTPYPYGVSANERACYTTFSQWEYSTVPVIVVQDELPRHEQIQPVVQLAYRNARPVNLKGIILHTPPSTF